MTLRRGLPLSGGLLLAMALVAVQAHAAGQSGGKAHVPLDDGPYIFNDRGRLEAAWLCRGEVSREPVSRQQILAPRCGYPYPLAIPVPAAPGAIPYREIGRAHV